jgi:hypothetical protein
MNLRVGLITPPELSGWLTLPILSQQEFDESFSSHFPVFPFSRHVLSRYCPYYPFN